MKDSTQHVVYALLAFLAVTVFTIGEVEKCEIENNPDLLKARMDRDIQIMIARHVIEAPPSVTGSWSLDTLPIDPAQKAFKVPVQKPLTGSIGIGTPLKNDQTLHFSRSHWDTLSESNDTVKSK